jgi:hypothetical protein
MKKIVSFGDSFVFGSELGNNHDGSKSWAGLAAKKLGVDYQTMSVPGCGNEHIARQVYSYFSNNPVQDTLAVINWTWGSRWDFYLTSSESWITLGPTCVPDKLKDQLPIDQASELIQVYRQFAGHSILWNRYRSLQAIYAVQSYMHDMGVANIQTHMDNMLFETEYHAPDYVQILQKLVSREIQTWEGNTFLEWCHLNNHAVTPAPGMHPLESAHEAAADFWYEDYKQALNI